MESNNFIRAFWYMSNNFGDNLNYYLIKKLSGKEPVYTDNRQEKHFIVCGSILSESNQFTTVWGAGFGWSDQKLHPEAEVCAVRGELSRKKIKKEVPVGDPALLMNLLHPVKAEKKHRFGIIPHWKDLEQIVSLGLKDIRIINPLQPWEQVIEEILSCEKILSTGLHGLILADTYGVPNAWLQTGTEIGGDGFKFKDYYSTTDSPDEKALAHIQWDSCRVHKYKYSYDALLKSCPFYHEK